MSTILKALDRHHLESSLKAQGHDPAQPLPPDMLYPSTSTRRLKVFLALLLIGNLVLGWLYWRSHKHGETNSESPPKAAMLDRQSMKDENFTTPRIEKDVHLKSSVALLRPEPSTAPLPTVAPTPREQRNIAVASDNPDKKRVTAKIVGIRIGCQFEAIKPDGTRILARLAGITCGDESSPTGLEARRTMTRMTFTRHFEINLLEQDNQGGWLAVLYLEDGSTLNDYLVANGLAKRLEKRFFDSEVNTQ
ncbi:MAG: thermonuclease family protein [Magnetococcales bacterium]|nr:thermonuclease family protein [Magnetococcales bacterium]